MATTDVDKVFVDTNVLVYANTRRAPLHNIALSTLQRLWNTGTELWISRQVIREYLATLTNPRKFNDPLPPIASVVARARFFQTQFHVAEEKASVTANLLTLMTEVPVGGKQVHDANIVATMLVHGIDHLLTHNVSDFERFSAYITVLPLEPQN